VVSMCADDPDVRSRDLARSFLIETLSTPRSTDRIRQLSIEQCVIATRMFCDDIVSNLIDGASPLARASTFAIDPERRSDSGEMDILNELMRTSFDDSTSTSSNEIADAAQALQILAATKGWFWTYNEVIVGHLWPRIVKNASSDAIKDLALEWIGRLVPVAFVRDSNANSRGVTAIRSGLRKLLLEALISMKLRYRVAEVIVRLSNGIPRHLSHIRDWHDRLTPNDRRRVPEFLRNAIRRCSMYFCFS